MSKNRINNPNFLPVPTKGIDLRIPVSSMPPEYSPFMINYMVNNGRLRKRNRHELWGYGSNTESAMPIVIPRKAATDVIVVGNNYTFSFAVAAQATTAAIVPPISDYIYFNGNLLIAAPGTVYILSETALTYTAGLTFTGVLSDRFPITAYRERVYVGSGGNLYYGGIGGYTAAAMTAFDVSFLLNGSRIFGLGTFNYSSGNTREQMLVIVGAQGEVLVYSGTYPAGSDWYLVNRFDLGIGQLDDDCPFELIEIDGDLLINPKFSHQLFSVRALLTGAKGASAEFPLFEAVEPLWSDALVDTAVEPGYKGIKSCVYWPQKSALVVHVNLQNVLKHPYLDRYRNIFPGFEDTNDQFNFLLYLDLNTNTVTMHSFPTSLATGQLRAGVLGVFAPVVLTTGGTQRAGAVQLFSDSFATGTNNKDWDGATAGSEAFDAHCVFAPTPQTSDVEAIKNAILFSNIHSSHSVSFGISENFDHGPPTLTSFSSSSSTVTPRSDILEAVSVGRGLMFHLRESGSYETAFESYGVRLLQEKGGLY